MADRIDGVELESALQQRADYIPIEDLLNETSQQGDLFSRVAQELTNRGLRTIVGPRGCGKTHMMRFAWLKCRDDSSMPFAVYVSFNRYFRLEPLLSSHASALGQFHSWVLARIILAVVDSAQSWQPEVSVELPPPLTEVGLQSFVSRTERNLPLDDDMKVIADGLSIERVQALIASARAQAGRKFSVLLMDDAALTLTPDYLIEFLDIVRSLKSIDLAPKASVYPGTTEVSPKFHQGQDSVAIPAWVCIEDPGYDGVMDGIAHTRVKGFQSTPVDVRVMLRFAAFGIPRAYLTMLDEFLRGDHRTTQQGVTRTIQEHLDARLAEFRSLGKKVPKLASLVEAGEKVLDGIAREIKSFNEGVGGKGHRQLTVGVVESELTPVVERMFNLLVEAGLTYDNSTVKHGTPSRIYRRYIPHAANLLSIRAIGGGESGGSIRQTVEAIGFKSAKHPVRKSLQRIVPEVDFGSLSLSLPKCASCHAPRMTDSQRFCHNCGQQLVDASTFSQCLETPIAQVPGLTVWQRTQIDEHLPNLKTLRDFLAKQDPAADLLTVRGFGRRRTARIVDVLNGFVDEYLS
ncbi:hypothetical protein B9Y78_11030 [Stenotrophomonas maltophilia]|nr:hypothetical protein A9K61_14245 [Stenotrophomonas maltophilia]PJL39486.1 hypothetical protein B9Y78_11030 [Stenotrophomonas maltophilia]BBQ11876.1 hypothetical protein WP1W18C01_22360 [Stenotrophomonas maltophilia]